MELSEAVRNRILNLAKSKNMSIHQLSLNSGIPYSTLNSFMNGKCKTPNLSTTLHICEGFGITLREFFSDKIFDNTEQD